MRLFQKVPLFIDATKMSAPRWTPIIHDPCCLSKGICLAITLRLSHFDGGEQRMRFELTLKPWPGLLLTINTNAAVSAVTSTS